MPTILRSLLILATPYAGDGKLSFLNGEFARLLTETIEHKLIHDNLEPKVDPHTVVQITQSMASHPAFGGQSFSSSSSSFSSSSSHSFYPHLALDLQMPLTEEIRHKTFGSPDLPIFLATLLSDGDSRLLP